MGRTKRKREGGEEGRGFEEEKRMREQRNKGRTGTRSGFGVLSPLQVGGSQSPHVVHDAGRLGCIRWF